MTLVKLKGVVCRCSVLAFEGQYDADSFVGDLLLQMFVDGAEFFTAYDVGGGQHAILNIARHPDVDAVDKFRLNQY